jgi:hypothetical protein
MYLIIEVTTHADSFLALPSHAFQEGRAFYYPEAVIQRCVDIYLESDMLFQ